MVKLNRTFLLVLCSAILLMIISGSASASVEYYEEEIKVGDGYQINNYVIDVTDVFLSDKLTVFKVYKNGDDEPICDEMIGINESFKFNFEDGEAELKLLSVGSGVLNRANVFITVKNVDIYVMGIVNGGHEYATYSGTPILEITTTVDVDNIEIGDFVKVTVNAKNIGDDKAVDIRFIPAILEGFTLDDEVIELPVDTVTIETGNTYRVYVYIYEAAKEGTFTLKPTTATFYNSAGVKFDASSNTPTITVCTNLDCFIILPFYI